MDRFRPRFGIGEWDRRWRRAHGTGSLFWTKSDIGQRDRAGHTGTPEATNERVANHGSADRIGVGDGSSEGAQNRLNLGRRRFPRQAIDARMEFWCGSGDTFTRS